MLFLILSVVVFILYQIGWNCQPTCTVQFDDCKVPVKNLLGHLGTGFTIAMKGLDGGRINIATCSVGAAQASIDLTRDYVKIRRQFKHPLADLQVSKLDFMSEF